MARVNDMIESKYLKQADAPDPIIVTVGKVGKVNIAKEGDAPEHKWYVRFDEFDKPLLLNSTNIKLLEMACGSDDTDDWIGKEVILYTDSSVSFGGQIVGGLRIRKQQAAPVRKLPHQPAKPAGKSSREPVFDPADDDDNSPPF